MMARLGELGEIITGNTPKTSEPENYASDDICFVKPSDISDGNITKITHSEFHISEHAREKARILPPGSVLVTCIGIIGKIAINSVECACNQQINAIVPDYGNVPLNIWHTRSYQESGSYKAWQMHRLSL